MHRSIFSRLWTGFAVLTLLGMIGCSQQSSESQQPLAPQIATGIVRSGSQPVSSSTIQLYVVGGSGLSAAPMPLLSQVVQSDAAGNFTLRGNYTCPSATDPVYITATGGNPGLATGTNNTWIKLVAALGPCGNLDPTSIITINEATTVGFVWGLQQFIALDGTVTGAPGSIDLQNAFVTAGMLVNTKTGTAQSTPPINTDDCATMNAMANILATCVSSDGKSVFDSSCGKLSTLVKPLGANQTHSESIALEIARNPGYNVQPLFSLLPRTAIFQPVLASAPFDWSLSLTSPAPLTLPNNLNTPTVFMGDSIFARWAIPLHNAAVSGQRSNDILSRIPFDVLGHGYSRMVLLAGANDILYPDATSPNAIQHIQDMAEMAAKAGMQPVLSLLPPLNPPGGVDYSSQVAKMNAAITSLAANKGYFLVDFNSPMQAHPEYFLDGVHPSPAGYAAMEAALAAVVRK